MRFLTERLSTFFSFVFLSKVALLLELLGVFDPGVVFSTISFRERVKFQALSEWFEKLTSYSLLKFDVCVCVLWVLQRN